MNKKRIFKDKEEVQEAFHKLQKKLEEEQIEYTIKNINQDESKYRTTFDASILISKEDEKRILPILIEYGFIKEADIITYAGKIPAKIIFNNSLSLEEYLNNFQGILYINKKKGMTSFDVVNQISNLFGIKRVGHTGTLDPLAEGVLIITINKATKIGELLTAEDKEYIAEVELGYETDTYDSQGVITKRSDVPTNLPIEEVVNSYQKTYLQEVPIYSAVKVHGKKLYEYARKKEEVILPKKEVTIKKIEIIENKNKSFTFRAIVTKGCYIRSLIRDIGRDLGTYATMTNLKRTKQGNVGIEQTNTLEELQQGIINLHTIEEVLPLPTIEVNDDLSKKVSNGVEIANLWDIQDKVIIKNSQGKILGIYEKNNDTLKTWKNFV